MSLRHSITLRLSLAFALLATLVFAALGIYLSRSADRHMTELDAHELLGKLALARHIGAQEGSPAGLARRLADVLVAEHGVIVAVDGGQGAIFRWPEAGLAAELATAGAQVGETPVRLTLAGQDYRVVAGELATAWGETARVVVARNINHHTDFLDQLQRDFWFAVLAAALLTMAVGMLIARRGMRPVRAIAQAAGRISAGRLAERIPEQDVPPELGELVQAFNAMLARLEESFTRLSEFSADIAHELRTPIHSLRMQTEVSLGKARGIEEYRELLASNLEEYERLSRIIGDMLFLAKADHGLVMPQRGMVELKALGERLFEYYGLLAENVDLRLVAEPLSVPGDALMLERALGNVLVNAIHHTPEQGAITVRIASQDGRAVIRIGNSGQPIPPDVAASIFERFVRLDAGREGSGLGLAITRSIVLAHGGSISVNAGAHDTTFVIELPLAA
ncbi:MAG: two-component sensor histidine kinase [Betaproteobacteria bacterium HGW-Betaproteobacteria-12]|nr:MAG: two-component sensor histidine kinase [Betaproteobacteria bacterium HGW-Betaproteobacteria-12]